MLPTVSAPTRTAARSAACQPRAHDAVYEPPAAARTRRPTHGWSRVRTVVKHTARARVPATPPAPCCAAPPCASFRTGLRVGARMRSLCRNTRARSACLTRALDRRRLCCPPFHRAVLPTRVALGTHQRAGPLQILGQPGCVIIIVPHTRRTTRWSWRSPICTALDGTALSPATPRLPLHVYPPPHTRALPPAHATARWPAGPPPTAHHARPLCRVAPSCACPAYGTCCARPRQVQQARRHSAPEGVPGREQHNTIRVGWGFSSFRSLICTYAPRGARASERRYRNLGVTPARGLFNGGGQVPVAE